MVLILIKVAVLLITAAIVALGLVCLARLTHKRHCMTGTDDVETAYVTAVATLYGIFLAFMIFVVWTRYYEARDNVSAEANTMAATYRMAGGLPQPLRTELQGLMLRYGRSVVGDEWNTMRRARPSDHTEAIVDQTWRLFNRMTPAEVDDSVLRDHLLTSWTRLSDLRDSRLLESGSGLSYPAYAVLVVGALIAIGLASVFTVDDFWTHAMKASALAVIIVMMLATVWVLDHPFSSQARLRPVAFTDVIVMLESRP